MNPFRSILILGLAVTLIGCDLGTYSKRYNERVGGMTVMANTNKDLANELIDIGGVAKIRIPKACYYDGSFKYGKSDDFLKARIPGMEIDGFVSSFMGDKESSDGNWYPFQVYFYVITGQNIEEAKKNIKAAVSKVSQSQISWDSEKIESYDGKEYVWNMATMGGTQPFLVAKDGGEKQENLNGRLDFYATSKDQTVLLVAFRAPSSVFADADQALVDGTLKSIQNFK